MKKVFFGFLVVICVVMVMPPLCFSGGGADEGYTLSLKKLIKEAEENIKKVDAEIKRQEVQKQNLQREVMARRHFEKGNSLYKLGKLKEALEEWQKALNLTDHADMKRHIKESDRKARKQQKTLKRQKRKTINYRPEVKDKKAKERKQKTPKIKETEKRRGVELDIVKPKKQKR
ncbi:MAG: tetratricopeptide repeat protein [Candidatus Omnitrophica bacterium]|nr:tetratricopeptide repeat protein [Candidatus Omnitrophota bacterium]